MRRVVLLVLALWGVGLIAGAAFTGRHYLRNSARFNLRHIDIAPTVQAPRDELRRIIARHAGSNLFRLDVASRCERSCTRDVTMAHYGAHSRNHGRYTPGPLRQLPTDLALHRVDIGP